MCNLYNLGRGSSRENTSWTEALREAVERMARTSPAAKLYNLRPTDTGLVVLPDNSSEPMRWGVPHERYPSVTNARGENLRRVDPWRRALDAGRRCLVPVESFYEFSGTKVKTANAFFSPSGDWLWVPGLWEDHAIHGRCYTMITTPPGPILSLVHDRQVASLDDITAGAWLAGEISHEFFREPRGVDLVYFPAVNPLKKGAPQGPPVPLSPDPPTPIQEELFG